MYQHWVHIDSLTILNIGLQSYLLFLYFIVGIPNLWVESILAEHCLDVVTSSSHMLNHEEFVWNPGSTFNGGTCILRFAPPWLSGWQGFGKVQISMSGIMDTVFNSGLNDEVVTGLAARSAERLAVVPAVFCYPLLSKVAGNDMLTLMRECNMKMYYIFHKIQHACCMKTCLVVSL